MPGLLENMKIIAFRDAAFTVPAAVPAFPVLINPESYTRQVTMEYDTRQAAGNNGGEAKYMGKYPETFNCDLVFDSTGIVDGLPRPSVVVETEALRSFLVDFEPEIHELRHFLIVWGAMTFRGRTKSLSLQYKLFNPNGTPIRAVARVSFIGSYSNVLQLALDKLLSPDLTQTHEVVAGDTLPNLCERYYERTDLVPHVARVNGLTSLRRLPTGLTLRFNRVRRRSHRSAHPGAPPPELTGGHREAPRLPHHAAPPQPPVHVHDGRGRHRIHPDRYRRRFPGGQWVRHPPRTRTAPLYRLGLPRYPRPVERLGHPHRGGYGHRRNPRARRAGR